MSKRKKSKEVFQPDDRFFNYVMSDKKNARAYLESFYPDIAGMSDLDKLEPVKNDFVRPTLKVFRSDVIYRCPFKNSDEQYYFSLIWEHKLEPEDDVAIQVGLYIFQILYKLSRDKKRKIEPVLPLIFSTEKRIGFRKRFMNYSLIIRILKSLKNTCPILIFYSKT